MNNNAKKLVDGAIAELKANLEQGKSEALVRYLECMSRFHNYSWSNLLLINRQCPTATNVAGFRRWQELGRWVRKGEKGIGIIAPMNCRKKSEAEAESEGERFIAGFRVVYVFDVAQTDGEAMPELRQPIGEPSIALHRLESAVTAAGITLVYGPLPEHQDGYSAPGEIGIADRLSPTSRFMTLAHELAHQWLGHHMSQRLSRTVEETEAEACAFVVARACGIDGAASSSDYIQLYSGDSKLLGESLGRIQSVSKRIIEAIDLDETRSASCSLMAA